MRWLLEVLCGLAARRPRAAALQLGRRLGGLLGRVIRYRRREVLRVLARAFPERGTAGCAALADAMYEHLGVTLMEVARAVRLGAAEADELVTLRHDEHLRRLCGEKEGALLLMGHIGNWEYGARLSRALPAPVHAVVKPLRPAGLQEVIERTRAALGLRLLSFRGDFAETLRALKRGEFVCVILDQNQRRNMGVFVDFLGAPACTSTGLAILSALTRRRVYPLYDRRLPDGRHEVRFLAPFDPPPNRDPATLQAATQEYTAVLERIIREEPAQWTWLHRRWKTRAWPGAQGKLPPA